MIKLEHVSKSYSAGIPALNDISLNIEEGEFVFIVGNSGSGKSTLIKLFLKDRNVYENVAFAQKVIGTPARLIRSSVPTMLSMVGLAAKYKSYPKQLSGGEQQRVAIARALVNQPKILLADEPTGNLDNHNAWEIMKLLEEINQKGTTVVVVTHNLEIVKAMKKRVITMKKGVIISDEKGDCSDED